MWVCFLPFLHNITFHNKGILCIVKYNGIKSCSKPLIQSLSILSVSVRVYGCVFPFLFIHSKIFNTGSYNYFLDDLGLLKTQFSYKKTHTGSGNKINQLKEITNFNNESLHEFYKSALFPCNVPATIRSNSIRVHFFHVTFLQRSAQIGTLQWAVLLCCLAPIGARVSSLHSTFQFLFQFLLGDRGKVSARMTRKIVKRSIFSQFLTT